MEGKKRERERGGADPAELKRETRRREFWPGRKYFCRQKSKM